MAAIGPLVRLALLLVALLLPLSVGPAAAATAAEQARIVALTNQARAANGLAPVAANAALTAAGEAYAASMAAASFFSHTGLDGSTLATRDEAAGYRGWSFLGENIAAGQQS